MTGIHHAERDESFAVVVTLRVTGIHHAERDGLIVVVLGKLPDPLAIPAREPKRDSGAKGHEGKRRQSPPTARPLSVPPAAGSVAYARDLSYDMNHGASPSAVILHVIRVLPEVGELGR